MSSFSIGQIISGSYRIDAFIASGGMGAVYRVWDEQRNVPLAMKVLHDDLVDDPALVKSFMREARALERLRHPNIVPFYGAKESLDRVFLLAHFINGPTLKSILKVTRLSVLDSLTILKALCAALGFAHRNNVVHCDVKPGNIMVDSGGNLYLTDFGIARHAESTRTTFGGAVGTVYYMAPEQFLEEQVAASTDVYALGVLLFEMLTGEKPFTGAEVGGDTDRTTRRQRIMHAHLKLPPPDPRSINPSIPENLALVVLKALAKRSQDRYQSTTEFFSMVCAATGIAVEAVPDRLDLPPEFKEDKFIEPGLPDQLKKTSKPGWLSLKTGMITAMVVVGSLVIIFASMSVGRNRGNSVVTPKTQRDEDVAVAAETATKSPIPTNTAIPDTATPIPPTIAIPTITYTPTSQPSDTPYVSQPRGKIVFTCQIGRDEIHNQICLINADGSNWRQMTTDDNANHIYASLAPDGQSIVYASNTDGEYEIYEMDLYGNRYQLTYNGENTGPAISPNGDYIVFTHTGSQRELWLMKRDGSNPHPILSSNSWGAWDPAWSPDGTRILFASDMSGDVELHMADINGSNVTQLTQHGVDYGTDKRIRGRNDWSPDGETVASYVGDTWHWEIFLINRNGTNYRTITYGGNNLAPSFSPDGKWVTYTSYAHDYGNGNACEVYIMKIDGSDQTRLTDSDYCNWQPRWGP